MRENIKSVVWFKLLSESWGLRAWPPTCVHPEWAEPHHSGRCCGDTSADDNRGSCSCFGTSKMLPKSGGLKVRPHLSLHTVGLNSH